VTYTGVYMVGMMKHRRVGTSGTSRYLGDHFDR